MRTVLGHFSLLALLLAGCYGNGDGGGDDTGPKDSEGTTGSVADIDRFINVTVAYTGDTTCYIPDSAYLTQTADPSCLVDQTLEGEVQDFQEEEPVGGAFVDFFFGDDINSSPDETLEADDNGLFTTEVPVCQPIGYKSSTPVDWDQTRDTFEVHQVWGFETGGTLSENVNSVSKSTSDLIPALLGVDWDETTGIIAGTAYDCNEETIEGAQVFVHDGTGAAPDTMNVFYFVDNFPNAKQEYTSPDGLWVAVNVPVGTWTAELYVYNGAQHVKIGETVLEIKSGSVNISNIFTGYGDGVRLPDECLTTCTEE